MPLWELEVSEITHQRVLYLVEADTAEEAVKQAQQGNSLKETLLKNEGVVDRHVHEEPVQVKERT